MWMLQPMTFILTLFLLFVLCMSTPLFPVFVSVTKETHQFITCALFNLLSPVHLLYILSVLPSFVRLVTAALH